MQLHVRALQDMTMQASIPAPARRRVVEWFAEVGQWPTSRKTVLLSSVACASQIAVVILAYPLFARLPGIDRKLFVVVGMSGGVAMAITLILSAIAARRGHEAHWTAYLLVLLYGVWITVFVQVFGSWSTPHFAIYPLGVILVALYYGERVGWISFVYGLLMLIGREALETSGVLPYAPLLTDRSVDTHHNLLWVGANGLIVMSVFVFCFFVSMLVVATRRLQDRRLREANARFQQSQESLNRSNHLLSRYIPRQLVERIILGEHPVDARTERRKLAIFFSDVEGFTQASDQMDPEELATLLDEYLAEMTRIAERYHGTINQFVGDGIMMFFGAPDASSDQDHARRAVQTALDMQDAMQDLRATWTRRGIRTPFRIRIGINSGYASVGDFGSPGRKVYSAIGLQTNLAARIQALCVPDRVLVSDTLYALVQDDFCFEDKGELTVRGLHYPVRLYEVCGRRSDDPATLAASEGLSGSRTVERSS